MTIFDKFQSSVNNAPLKIICAFTSLSKYLTSPDVVQKFTSWTLVDTLRVMEKWEVTKFYIQEALTKRLSNFIEVWEEHVFSGARGSLIQHFQNAIQLCR